VSAVDVTGTVVIVGAGQAGLTAAVSLRESGWTGAIHLVGDEPGAPYQRPPLSKGFLAGTETEDDLVLRALQLFERDGIGYRSSTRVDAIARDDRTVRLADGTSLGYDQLILATGSAPRAISIPGAKSERVHILRSYADALALRGSLAGAREVVIVGGGFLGLEVAAFAAKNSQVTVLERSGQLLSRAVSAPIAASLAHSHAKQGVDIRYNTTVVAIVASDGRATGVELSDGAVIAADVVVVAVGATPNTALAEEAGLAAGNGFVVDGRLRTQDPRIRAIGDCAFHPNRHAGRAARLESVQNAVDQARFVAKDLIEPSDSLYGAVPWFWSRQGDQNLQIAGIAEPGDSAILETSGAAVTVTRVRDGKIVAIETLNSPGAHIRARRLLSSGPVLASAVRP